MLSNTMSADEGCSFDFLMKGSSNMALCMIRQTFKEDGRNKS
jgi:hypothetical protein